MTLQDLLPWLNVLLLPILSYVVKIEQRVTRLEALREADKDAKMLQHKSRGTAALRLVLLIATFCVGVIVGHLAGRTPAREHAAQDAPAGLYHLCMHRADDGRTVYRCPTLGAIQ